MARPVPASPIQLSSAAVTAAEVKTTRVPADQSATRCCDQIPYTGPVTTAPASPRSTANTAKAPSRMPSRGPLRGTVPTMTASAVAARYPPSSHPTTR